MPVDENTRLRIRQYLIELMDESAADAIMESMPPIPWTQLATKDDIARLDGRLVGIDGRLDSLTSRVDQTSSDLQELTRIVAQQGASLGARMDSTNERIDAVSATTNERIDGLGASLGQRLDGISERIDAVSASMGERIDGVSERIDGVSASMDTMSERMGDLSRTVTVGFFSMALTLAVFMIGTIASLFAAGAFG